MAKPRKSTPASSARSVTAERAARLYRLLQLVAAGPQTRQALIRRLRLDVRSFYRDLELLRTAGILLELHKHRYTLPDDARSAVDRLPFPDPGVTLGEARQLAKGRTAAHRKLRSQIARIVR
jgi:predicted DNA-binding transcriptional regulator YafY